MMNEEESSSSSDDDEGDMKMKKGGKGGCCNGNSKKRNVYSICGFEVLFLGLSLYLIFLTLVNIVWYTERVYNPPAGFYQFYPLAVQLACFLNVYRDNVKGMGEWKAAEPMMAGGIIVMGILGVALAWMGLVVYHQTDFPSVSTQGGTWIYPNTQIGRLNITNHQNPTNSGRGASDWYLMCTWVNTWISLGFSLIGTFVGVYFMSQITPAEKDKELEKPLLIGKSVTNTPPIPEEGEENPFRHTVEISWTISIFTLLILATAGFAHIVMAFVIYTQSAIPFTLFQNQHVWTYFILMVGIFPPSRPRDFLNRGLMCVAWILGLGVALFIGIWTLVLTATWRSQNHMDWFCPNGTMFNERILYFPANSEHPEVQYSTHWVLYTSYNGDQATPKDTMVGVSCADDIMSFLVTICTLVVLILAILYYTIETKDTKLPTTTDDKMIPGAKARGDYEGGRRSLSQKKLSGGRLLNAYPTRSRSIINQSAFPGRRGASSGPTS
jgi:hypothetical protein